MVDLEEITIKQMVGIGLTVSGTIFSSIGANIQTYFQHMHIFFDPGEKSEFELMQKSKPYYCHVSWIGGFCLIILGAIIELAALGYTSQSILTPIWCIGFISNFLFARVFLNEPFSKPNVIGVLLILFGTVVLTIFGAEHKPVRNTDSFQRLFSRSSFIGYISCIIIFCIIIFLYLRYLKSSRLKKRPLLERDGDVQRAHSSISPQPRFFNSQNAHHFKNNPNVVDEEAQPRQNTQPDPKTKSELFCYFTLAGILGGHSVMFFKIAVELTVATALTDFHELGRYLFWISSFVAVLLVFFQLAVLLNSVQEIDNLHLLPVFQMSFLLSSVMSGIVFFEELFSLSPIQKFAYILGAGATLVGAYLVARHNLKSAKAGKLIFTGTLSLSKILDDLLLSLTFKLNEYWMYTQEEKDYEHTQYHIAGDNRGHDPTTHGFLPSNSRDQDLPNPLGKDDATDISSASKFFGDDVRSETSSMTDGEGPNSVYSFENTNQEKAIASFLKWTSAASENPEPEPQPTDFVAQHAAMQQQQHTPTQQHENVHENQDEKNDEYDEKLTPPEETQHVENPQIVEDSGGVEISEQQQDFSGNFEQQNENTPGSDEESVNVDVHGSEEYSFSQAEYAQGDPENSSTEVNARDMSNWESD